MQNSPLNIATVMKITGWTEAELFATSEDVVRAYVVLDEAVNSHEPAPTLSPFEQEIEDFKKGGGSVGMNLPMEPISG